GVLTREALPTIDLRKPVSVGAARCQLEVTTAGKVCLKLNNVKDVSLWVGAAPVPLQETTTLDLPVGLHTLTFVFDLAGRRDGLTCELDDAPGSSARARVIGGK